MSATNVARGQTGNIRVGNNVSATMCPRLPGPLVFATVIVIMMPMVQFNSAVLNFGQGHLLL